MKEVLVIAYYFPPMGLGGVQRVLKFVKYLPEFGWKPTVLTVKPRLYFAFDTSLSDEIPGGTEVKRTDSFDPLRLLGFLSRGNKTFQPAEKFRRMLSYLNKVFFVPDNKIGWIPFGLAEAREEFLKRGFEAIYATAPPFTCHLLGLALKKITRKPLVVDFRDAWTQYQFATYPTPFHLWINQFLEERVVRSADKIITTNDLMRRNLKMRYPTLGDSKFEVITHGFDPDDFKTTKLPDETKGKFCITYTGSFWENLTPRYFLLALREAIEQNARLAGEVKAIFIGLFGKENEKLIEELNLKKVVDIKGYLPHPESIAYLMGSDLLWMMMGSGKGAEAVTPGKLFEYIGSRKPILACVPPRGAAAEIARSLGNAKVVPPENTEKIKEAILKYYSKYKEDRLKKTDPEVVDKFNRKHLTEKLAWILDEA